MTTKNTTETTYTPSRKETSVMLNTFTESFKMFTEAFKSFKASGKDLFEKTVEAYVLAYHLPAMEDMEDKEQLKHLKVIKGIWRKEIVEKRDIVSAPTFNSYLSNWVTDLGYAKDESRKPKTTGGSKGKGKKQLAAKDSDNESEVNLTESTAGVSFDLSNDDDTAIDELTNALLSLSSKRFLVVLNAIKDVSIVLNSKNKKTA